MLEGLVRIIKPKDQTRVKALGDIIVAKLSPAVWGIEEFKKFLVVQFEDDELEGRLRQMKKSGEPYPSIPLPYAVRDNDGNVVLFSAKNVDVSKLDGSMRDIDVAKPVQGRMPVIDKTVGDLP